jgi:hypothetical protein
VAGIAQHTRVDLEAHPLKHLNHARSHVLNDHDIDAMVLDEAGDTGMVSAITPGIVEDIPPDVALLPALNFAVLGRRDGDTLRPTPRANPA